MHGRMEVDDLMAASRPDPDKPDEIWETGKDFVTLRLDHIPADAPHKADLGRYSKHLSGGRTVRCCTANLQNLLADERSCGCMWDG